MKTDESGTAVRHRVRVPLRLGLTVTKSERQLDRQGVQILPLEQDSSPSSEQRYFNYLTWDALGHAWLVFSITRTALEEWGKRWPKIREILINAGLTNDEITTLGLSDLGHTLTAKPRPKKRKRAKSRSK